MRQDNEPLGNGRYIEMAGALRPATDDEIKNLDKVAGTATATHAEKEEARAGLKQAKFAAECDAIVACLPIAPKSTNNDDLMSALAVLGKGCSAPTLKVRMTALVKDRRVVDLSDGTQKSARRWALPPSEQ